MTLVMVLIDGGRGRGGLARLEAGDVPSPSVPRIGHWRWQLSRGGIPFLKFEREWWDCQGFNFLGGMRTGKWYNI